MRSPDVESMVLTFLRGAVSIPWASKVPNPRPKRFGRVWRTGGGSLSRIHEVAQITVTCTAESSVVASDDATAAKDAFLQSVVLLPLVRGEPEVSGPYYDPDPDTNEDRYTFTVRLRVRAAR